MIVRINQTAVDFTLEHETTVAQVVSSLLQWAASEQLAVRGILVDGLSYSPGDARPLASVESMDVETVPAAEEQRARAEVITSYFELVVQALRGPNPALLEELRGEYANVRAALFPLLAPWEGRVSRSLALLDGSWSAPSVAEASEELARAASEREKELGDPHEALGATLGLLESQAATLADLGLLFQRGQDKEAFAQILGLFTLVEDLERRAELFLNQNAEARDGWVTFSAELQPFLKETEAALDATDYILLTDLLEYEILPRLLTARALFPRLSKLDPVGDVL